jgi:hypothetical protein
VIAGADQDSFFHYGLVPPWRLLVDPIAADSQEVERLGVQNQVVAFDLVIPAAV